MILTALFSLLIAPLLARTNAISRLDVLARLMMGALFVLAGVGKAGALQETQVYMAEFGIPAGLVWPTIAFELVAGGLLIVGVGSRLVALALAVFTLASAMVFHRVVSDPTQMVMLLKNIAIAGGLLLFVKHGSETFSFDRKLQKE